MRSPAMKPKSKPKRTGMRDSLVGIWRSGSELGSDVEITLRRKGASYSVDVCDAFDGEKADIFEIAWDGSEFSFAAHWNSTGRFARYRIRSVSEDRISLTYTYTDTEMYHRRQNTLEG